MKQIPNIHDTSWLDKATFQKILAMWLTITLLFGCIYFFFSSPSTSLVYSKDHSMVNNFSDTIYFSFVAATTTGF